MKLFCLRKTQLEHVLERYGINTVVSWLPRKGALKSQIEEFFDRFASEKPDAFFFLKDEQLDRKLLLRLKAVSPKTKFIMYYGDQRGGVPSFIHARRDLLSALLINNEDPQQFRMYKDIGIKNVFTFHHGVPVGEFQDFPTGITHDVFFGGNNFNHKKFPLSKFRYDLIMRVHGVFNLVVYGEGWPFKTEKRVPRHVYAKVLRRAKINLGMNHYDVVRYYDRRLFECMASGRVHITRYVPGMEKHFENGKHLVWFHTIKQALNSIQNLLKYPEKREEIAKAGKSIIFSHHSFEVRAEQLKDILFLV